MTGCRCIAADPPWQERGGGKSKRGADRHYPLLSTPDIARVMLDSPEWRPAESCHLWMWATSNHLPAALSVLEALGFRYVTSAVWVKMDVSLGGGLNIQTGLGQYMRHAHEWLLFATRGKAMVPETGDRPPSVIVAPRTKHSAKPAEAYEVMERVSPGPRLEMFARAPRGGWSVWGSKV